MKEKLHNDFIFHQKNIHLKINLHFCEDLSKKKRIFIMPLTDKHNNNFRKLMYSFLRTLSIYNKLRDFYI